jgi:hypothetical protein
MSSTEETQAKAVIGHLLETGHAGNHGVVDDAYVDHGFWRNKGKLLQTLTALCAAYPNLACTVEGLMSEGDTVAAFYTLTGSSRSEETTIHAVRLFRLQDGQGRRTLGLQ